MAINDVLDSLPTVSDDEFVRLDAEQGEQEGQQEPPKEPEQKEPEQKEPEQVQQQKTVPLEALREERERRKELQAQLQAMEHRLQMILNAMQQPKTPEPAPTVEYEEDPIAYLRAKIDALNEQIARMSQTTETQAQQQQYEAFTRNIAAAEQQFAKEHPDYWDAVQFLRERRTTELKALGFTEQQIAPVLAQDAALLVQQAAANKQNPAEFAYSFAQQLGYQVKAAQPQASVQQTPAAPAFEPPTSLGAATGSTNTGMPTAQEISKMSDAEFQTLFKKYFPG